MSAKTVRHDAIPCPCEGCSTVFSGTQLQIANNFKTHYFGKHIKHKEQFTIDINKKEKLAKIIGDAYEEIIGSFEPDVTIEDEYLISEELQEGFGKSYDLKMYLSTKPICCREERQFALFLANRLRDLTNISGKNELWINRFYEKDEYGESLLRTNDRIIEVYYEVAIMRDYWHLNKCHFNKCLYDYVVENGNLFREYCSQEQALSGDRVDGRTSKLHANKWVPTCYIARWMMNSKPDLGLIIENKGDYRLSFLECKYMSEEDEYMNSNIPGRMKQTELQEHTLNFLCNKLNVEYDGNYIKKGHVGLIRFINGNNKYGKGEIAVPIENLTSQCVS